MLLCELFDNNSPITWNQFDAGGAEGEFSIKGKKYFVRFILSQGNERLPQRLDIEFALLPANSRAQHTTVGTGDEFKVFASVSSAVKEYIDQYPQVCVSMTASEQKRLSLYASIVKRIFPTWKIETKGAGLLAWDPSKVS